MEKVKKNIKEIIEESISKGVNGIIKADSERETYEIETKTINIDVRDYWALKAGKTIKITIETDKKLGYRDAVKEDFEETLSKGVTGRVMIGEDDLMILEAGIFKLQMDRLLEMLNGERISFKAEECKREDVESDFQQFGDEKLGEI